MFKKLKTWVTVLFVFVLAQFTKLFYRKEIKEYEQFVKDAVQENQKKVIEAMKKDASSLPPEEKAILDHHVQMQNELLKVFVTYIKEIRGVSGPQMDSVGSLWIQTTQGLNQTLQNAFKHQDEKVIKKHLAELEYQMNLAIVTNQEIVGTTSSGGGFGYSGPIGEA